VSCNRPWFLDGSGEAVDSYRTARLDVQRHEVEDPAEPPLLVRELPVPDAAGDFRRSVDAGYVTLPDWGPTPAPTPAVADVETGGAL
jgi:hypothetical protein